MTVRQLLGCLVFTLALAACNPSAPIATAPDTPTPAASPTDTPTLAPTDTPTLTATATPSPTSTFTPSPTATETPRPTPTTLATPTPGPNPIYSSLSPEGCTPFVTCIPTPAPPSITLEDTENILLLGSDLRPDDNTWRTDTMLLVAVDRANKRVGILSFPRDYWLYIPGYTSDFGANYQRINQVDFIGERVVKHPKGGFGLLQDVFQRDFGIRIDRFARLHRQGFIDIVDALGGVDVNLECEVWELSPTEGFPGGFNVGGAPFYVLHVPVGANHLDGETALKFVTYRYNSADWDRARRQQIFLANARQQFVNAGLLTQVPRLWGIFRNYFKTNLGLADLIRLGALARDLDMENVHARVIDYLALEPVPLRSGAAVSTSKGNSVFQVIEGLFDAPPIESASQPAQGCLPRPRWGDDYLATLRPAPAASSPTPLPTDTPAPAPTDTPAP